MPQFRVMSAAPLASFSADVPGVPDWIGGWPLAARIPSQTSGNLMISKSPATPCARCDSWGATPFRCVHCGLVGCAQCLTQQACETGNCPRCGGIHRGTPGLTTRVVAVELKIPHY